MKVSKAQILAFITPYIAIISGAVATWLFVHLHVLALFHVSQSAVAVSIASSVVFAVSAGLTWVSHHYHWLPITLAKLNAPRGS